MSIDPKANIQQAVPFLLVADMDQSLSFYIRGLGFKVKSQWTPRGKIEWCWLQNGGAALMLQEQRKDIDPTILPEGPKGIGIAILFICEDAIQIYLDAAANGLAIAEPIVENSMWVTSLKDPDGYSVLFESHTDVLEETKYSEWLQNGMRSL